MEISMQDMLMTIGKQTMTIAILEERIKQLEDEQKEQSEGKKEVACA